MDSPIIRPARLPDDVAALTEVHLSSAAHHAQLRPDLYRVPDRAALTARYRDPTAASNPGHVVIVAELAGQVIGCTHIRIAATRDEPASMLRPVPTATVEIAVLPAHRGQGVGAALMATAEQSAHDLGAHRIHLDMLADNTSAQSFHQNLGYEPFGLLMDKRLTHPLP